LDLSNATDQESRVPWHRIVDVLAGRIADQIPKLTDLDQAMLVWRQFRDDLTIASLGPLANGVLDRVQQKLSSRLAAWKPNYSLTYLAGANALAIDWVNGLEVRRLGKPHPELAAVPILVVFDAKGEQRHASSVRGASEIRWALQMEPYTLWGCLVADRVFEHEYFCHLLPVNTFLGTEVREGFLDGVLQYEHAGQAAPGNASRLAESRWNYALHRFCEDLLAHFSRVTDDQCLTLRNLAQNPRGIKPTQYWEIVSRVLSYPDGKGRAKELRDDLLANI
jgi:hypothetical protein